MARYTLDDLMVIAGIEHGTPTYARSMNPADTDPPFAPNDVFHAEDGERFLLAYDDGKLERTVVVTIEPIETT